MKVNATFGLVPPLLPKLPKEKDFVEEFQVTVPTPPVVTFMSVTPQSDGIPDSATFILLAGPAPVFSTVIVALFPLFGYPQ